MPTNTKMECVLCRNTVGGSQSSLSDEENVFCCKGCQVVYRILEAQGGVGDFQNHPIYQQALKGGLIANPALAFPKDEEAKIPEDDFLKLHLSIQNMWCPSCAQVIHLMLMREKGVRSVIVDYSTDLASIEFTPRLISKEKVLEVIEKLGYRPDFLQDPRQKSVDRSLMLRLIVAAFFSLNVMMFAYPIYATYFDKGDGEGYAMLFAWLSLAGSLPVLLYSGWPIWRRCYTGIKVGIWGMETLVTMGVAAATALSLYELFRGSSLIYFDSVTVIILFVLVGKMMESKAKFSAKDALIKLTLAMPRKGRKKMENGEEVFVPIKEIVPGDLLVVRMGEKIVLDGCVEEGRGACDESLMTGESLPVTKEKGATVLAGTVLQQGMLVINVTASLEDSALQRIIDMVCQEIGHKSKYVRAADRIVKWFVPFVLLLATAVGVICFLWEIMDQGRDPLQTAMVRGISILLISCPCAIGIAAPVAESYLLNALAKLGILVRNRGALPYLGKETLFVFDKTGTVTEGRFTVCSGLEELTFEDKMALKGLVSHSNHPIAAALHGALLCPPANLERIEEVIGKGILGSAQGATYLIGSAKFLLEEGIGVADQSLGSDDLIATTVYFAKNQTCLTSLRLGDRLKPGIEQFVQELSPIPTLLVSGDAEPAVAKVAMASGINHWLSGYTPLQKKETIDKFRENGEIVAMLGDGMNDAPALTAAHVGIAVVTATEFSIQVSDLLLTTPHFNSLSLMRRLAIKGRKIVNQNLFWAFFYNCVGLGLAAAGLLTPLFAAFAMVISSLIVLLNAQRIETGMDK